MEFMEFFRRMGSLSVFPLFVAYMAMVGVVPRFWKRYTNPMELRLVLLLYNMLCSALSLYATVGMAVVISQLDVIYTNSATPGLMPYYRVYAYTKIIELLDTVFMIVRHKGRQITFLHVFHHSTMLLLIFYAMEYSPWTALAPGLVMNSFVHVVLYFYYGYTAYFKSHRPSWKRRLTELQIIQFVLDLIYCAKGILYHDFCVWSGLYGSSMLILFSNFYIKSYLRSAPTQGKLQAHQNGYSSNAPTDGERVSAENKKSA